MSDLTRRFDLSDMKEWETREILTEVYNSLQQKGYNPINQIVGYILSEDPTYITNFNNARTLIRQLDRDELLQELGHEPSPEEIAHKLHLPLEKVEEVMRIGQEPISLETPVGEEDDSHLGDFIQDDDASQPAEEASYTLLREQLEEVLKTLTPREEEVLRMRFGLIDGKPHTLEEVGKKFDVTRERIRQIESKALRKLRHPSRSKKLRDFLN